MRHLNFIDLFAGAGGLSEGFIRAGFRALAHVEMDVSACDTLRTRIAFHELNSNSQGKDVYEQYLREDIDRKGLYSAVDAKLFEAVINQEISSETIDRIFGLIDHLKGEDSIDVVVGGPPCQAYSLVGRARDPLGMKHDKRNYLFTYYGEFLKRYQPRYFVFENVLGLLSAGNSSYFNEMQILFKRLGYQIDHRVLNSEDFGVLQKRKRVVIVGKHTDAEFKFSWPEREENKFEILKDLFADLPSLAPGDAPPFVNYTNEGTDYLNDFGIRNGFPIVSQHITRAHHERDLEIYQIAIQKFLDERIRLLYTDLPMRLQTHRNKDSFLDRFKVVDPNGKSHTLVAHISKDGHHYIYPDISQIRSLSVREAARIQSFPDDYYFEGGRTAAYRQVGNAVPPLMAHSISRSILHEIRNNDHE